MSREATKGTDVKIALNGIEQYVATEESAERITQDFYATTKIIHLNPAQVRQQNVVTVTFPDGKGGGVGSAVMRITYGEPIEYQEPDVLELGQEVDFEVFPIPADQTIRIETHDQGWVELFDVKGQRMLRKTSVYGNDLIDVKDLPNGIYLLRSNYQGGKPLTKKITIKNS